MKCLKILSRPSRNSPTHFSFYRALSCCAVFLFMTACASNRVEPPTYDCAAKPDTPPTFAWAFRVPEATPTDRASQAVGRHYAGPT